MFVFDHPYISDVATNFLVASQSPVLANDFARQYIPDNANFISDDTALQLLKKQNCRWLYSNSENAISWITDKLGRNSEIAQNIELFKNKHTFREATKQLFPHVSFLQITASELTDFNYSAIGKPFIIKPVVGFISAGVYRVNNEAEWLLIKQKILQETEAVAAAFPDAVLNSKAFIIESIIEGEEYAIDAYFDDDGNPVILNILHHHFTDENDMSDRLYVTSAAIIDRLHDPLDRFLHDIAKLGDFCGMPFHLEVRINEKEDITPIEINPLRFAGWCSTDIAYYAYGINVYEYFSLKKKPQWEQILAGKNDKQYGLAVIEKQSDIEPNQFFNYEGLAEQFNSVISLRKIDYRNFPLYAFLFFETPKQQTEELGKALKLNPDKFIKDNPAVQT